MRKAYAGDVSREKFGEVLPLLESMHNKFLLLR